MFVALHDEIDPETDERLGFGHGADQRRDCVAGRAGDGLAVEGKAVRKAARPAPLGLFGPMFDGAVPCRFARFRARFRPVSVTAPRLSETRKAEHDGGCPMNAIESVHVKGFRSLRTSGSTTCPTWS